MSLPEPSLPEPRVIHQGLIPYVLECFFGRWTFRAMVAGVAIGTILGFVPKTNLIAVVLLGLLFFSPANVVTGLAATLVAAVASLATEVAANEIGGFVVASLTDILQWASESIPLVAWLGLESPRVVGQFLIGLGVALLIALAAWGLRGRD